MRFHFEHNVPLPMERLFSFFENPERIELLHAGWSKLRLLHCENRVRVGAETWVELMIAGCIPMVLGFRHCLFEPPFRFGEQAIHGPFSKFLHIHEFAAQNRGTVVRDLLEVSLPWHYGPETIMRRLVAPGITRMFHSRAVALKRLVDAGTVERCVEQAGHRKER
jgi:ligand-binding SRPBCC domain-containing protein